MASWNIPALINKISEDVPAIKALLTALFKWTDAGTEDVPEGAKRLQSVTGGRQIQEYSGSSWGSVGKLMHDVDMLDGKHASTAQTPDTIPVRDANGSIPGNVTGNAATATTASSVSSEYVVPIANGGTGATSAAGARTNLGTNNAENITQGILATARGGTGRNDGKVTDVFLEDYQTGAVGLGQLGQAAAKNAVDCDTLTRQGKYFCTGATLALHYPLEGNVALDVYNSGDTVIQKVYNGDLMQSFRRLSSNGGASWQAWQVTKFNTSGNVNIYISKGGSDSNRGINSDAPVLTWGRAFQIAKELSPSGTIAFFCGPGEWGDVTIYISDFTCANVCVTNYVHSSKNTIAEFEALTDSGNTGNQPPHFTSLTICYGTAFLGNINADHIWFNNVCCIGGNNCFKFGRMDITNGRFDHGADFIVNKVTGVTAAVFTLVQSYLYLGNITCKFVNSPANGCFIYSLGVNAITIENGFTASGTFSGDKYGFQYPPVINPLGLSPQAWPGIYPSGGLAGTYFYGNLLYTSDRIRMYSNIIKGASLSQTMYTNIIEVFEKRTSIYDGQQQRLFLLEGANEADGTSQIYLGVYRNEANTADVALLSLRNCADGTKYATCPTPALNDNSDKIATTNWVRSASGNTTLNAATATKLATARTIFGRSFDGSGNVAGAVDAENIELLGYPNVHGGFIDFHYGRSAADYTSRIIEYDPGMITLEGELFVTNLPNTVPQIRLAAGSKSFFFRNDGANFYLLKTADNDAKGLWDTTRPLIVNGATGICSINGNAATATKSNTADTPAANDNSTRTATTAWVRGRLSGSEYSMVPSNNPEQRSVGTTYTAGTNGFFKVETNDIGDYWASVWVNGHESRVHIGEYGSGGNWSGNLVFIPVKRGWTYSCSHCSWCAFQAAG